ncbi:MAG: sigma-70 family RNA polymerase sigma factor [Clostridia bacterium]|nr:sigma-70 family RNA polymerase sigma factor [Clostridia bacterium]
MQDAELIELFNSRDERAISAAREQYGGLMFSVARNILKNNEDAEEAVNDALFKAWNSIPPEDPKSVRAYLASITKHAALDAHRRKAARKRGLAGIGSLDELNECIPSAAGVEDSIDAAELSAMISRWLRSLEPERRVLFVRRYRYGDSIEELSKRTGIHPKRLSKRLSKLRAGLKKYLESEGEFI